MYDLSIIIPARNEFFLGKTIENILENITGNSEIIAILDGYTIDVPNILEAKNITVICHSSSVGQRAACNEGARLSNSKYLMKVDAHCSFDKGFDVKMMEKMQDNFTMVPIMRNLHAFDWVCENGHSRYQGPSGPCKECGKPTEMNIKWIGKTNPQSTSYTFDTTPHFQYFNEYKHRVKPVNDLTETMSLQGSCFMITKDKWFELNICDETFGSWGSQGIEVALKTWLSGGKVVCNHNTWYAHMFRTQGGDFGFPYPNSGNQVERAKKYAKELFFTNKWDKAIHPLSWLVEKFMPIPFWKDTDIQELKKLEYPSKGILYYTDNSIDENILKMCQNNLTLCANGYKIICVSQKETNFGENIVMNLKRSAKSMFQQILTGLEALNTDIVFFAEHDVMYDKSHFDFIPLRRDTFYYNTNVWFLRWSDMHCLYYEATQLSGLCAYREELITHFKERLKMIDEIGFSRNMGFEPMTHGRIKWENQFRFEQWQAEVPNIDIKHGKNQLRARWKKEEFRRVPKIWIEDNKIPGWDLNKLKGGI